MKNSAVSFRSTALYETQKLITLFTKTLYLIKITEPAESSPNLHIQFQHRFCQVALSISQNCLRFSHFHGQERRATVLTASPSREFPSNGSSAEAARRSPRSSWMSWRRRSNGRSILIYTRGRSWPSVRSSRRPGYRCGSATAGLGCANSCRAVPAATGPWACPCRTRHHRVPTCCLIQPLHPRPPRVSLQYGHRPQYYPRYSLNVMRVACLLHCRKPINLYSSTILTVATNIRTQLQCIFKPEK